MKILFNGFITIATLALAGPALANTCSEVADYVDAGEYQTGARAKIENTVYQCLVGGWCSTGGAYEPGVGWAWEHAWQEVGECTAGDSDGDGDGDGNGDGDRDEDQVIGNGYEVGCYREYNPEAVENGVLRVSNGHPDGTTHNYACKTLAWCRSGAPYTPGQGWAWEHAWEDLGQCGWMSFGDAEKQPWTASVIEPQWGSTVRSFSEIHIGVTLGSVMVPHHPIDSVDFYGNGQYLGKGDIWIAGSGAEADVIASFAWDAPIGRNQVYVILRDVWGGQVASRTTQFTREPLRTFPH